MTLHEESLYKGQKQMLQIEVQRQADYISQLIKSQTEALRILAEQRSWASRLEAMERAGAEQAQRADENLEIIRKLRGLLQEWTEDPKECGCETGECTGLCLPARSRAALNP